MAARLTTLRPAPRPRSPLSYGDVEAGLAALGVDLPALMSGTGGTVSIELAPDVDTDAFLECILDDASRRRARGYTPVLRRTVAEWTAKVLADGIARAAEAAGLRRARHVDRLEPLLRSAYTDWREGNQKSPSASIGVQFASQGYAAWRTIQEAPFADVLLFAADAEMAAFDRDLEESARKARELIQGLSEERLG